MKFRGILLTFCIILFSMHVWGEHTTEEKNVLMVVNKFFKVLETGDTELAKEILISKGSNFSVREDGNSSKIKFTDYKTLIESLPKSEGKYKEEIIDPEILIHKNIAVVWAKYKFFINKKFSHCGVDSFSLIKDKKKWRIASIIYTVEKSGCK